MFGRLVALFRLIRTSFWEIRSSHWSASLAGHWQQSFWLTLFPDSRYWAERNVWSVFVDLYQLIGQKLDVWLLLVQLLTLCLDSQYRWSQNLVHPAISFQDWWHLMLTFLQNALTAHWQCICKEFYLDSKLFDQNTNLLFVQDIIKSSSQSSTIAYIVSIISTIIVIMVVVIVEAK